MNRFIAEAGHSPGARALLLAGVLLAASLALTGCLSDGAGGKAVPPAVVATAEPPTPEPTLTPTPTATPSPTPIPSPLVRLAMPGLKIDVPVEEMKWQNVNTANGVRTEWSIPENAAGHASNSALPGQPGNIVISGHNNIAGRVFLAISQAWPSDGYRAVDKYTDSADVLNGQKVELTTADGRRTQYTITHFYRLKEADAPLSQQLANARYIAPTDTEQLTVTTCWPPWGNIDRLVLIAVPGS